ncbi:hypothetical protein [Flavobacterium sp. WC2509]|uniref:hypothetical protein n=1 Tax=Flavobacterium sp. WC2509 TaxID=3461406 RepID=UPI004044BF29
MKEKILIFLILFSSSCIGQEVFNSQNDIYIRDSLFYNKKNDSLFNGSIEFKKNNGIIVFKKDYEKGYLVKVSEYYNKSAKGRVYKEIYYNSKQFSKKLKEVYYHTNGKIYSIKYFDFNSDKNLEESYDESGKLVYSCEYKGGKKNGKEFCLSKKGDNLTDYYINGKKVK